MVRFDDHGSDSSCGQIGLTPDGERLCALPRAAEEATVDIHYRLAGHCCLVLFHRARVVRSGGHVQA